MKVGEPGSTQVENSNAVEAPKPPKPQLDLVPFANERGPDEGWGPVLSPNGRMEWVRPAAEKALWNSTIPINLRALAETEAFRALPLHDQALIILLARADAGVVDRIVALGRNRPSLSVEEQAKILQQGLRSGALAPWTRIGFNPSWVPAAQVSISQPEQSWGDFSITESSPPAREIHRYRVTVEGVETVVEIALKIDAGFSQLDIHQVAEVLRKIPKPLRSKIGTLTLHPRLLGEEQDGKSAKAGVQLAREVIHVFAQKTGSLDPDDLVFHLIHEIGHRVNAELLGKFPNLELMLGGFSEWKDAMALDSSSVSQYGLSSLKEDFAESFALYVVVKGTPAAHDFRAVYPERFRLLDRYFTKLGIKLP